MPFFSSREEIGGLTGDADFDRREFSNREDEEAPRIAPTPNIEQLKILRADSTSFDELIQAVVIRARSHRSLWSLRDVSISFLDYIYFCYIFSIIRLYITHK